MDGPLYPPIDYLKFLFACDSEMWQDKYQADWFHLRSLCVAWGAKDANVKLTVLGGGKTVGSRTIVEFVGPVADYIAPYIPVLWTQRSRRVDFRSELRTLTVEAIRAAKGYYSLKPKGEYNATGFDTPGRRKTTGRDIGGVGMFLGSRKSDVVGAIYRRGRETPAFELRVQNDLCRDITQRIWRDSPPSTITEFLNQFYSMSAPHEEKLLHMSIDCKRPADIPATFELIRRHMPDADLLPSVQQMQLGENATRLNAERMAEFDRQELQRRLLEN